MARLVRDFRPGQELPQFIAGQPLRIAQIRHRHFLGDPAGRRQQQRTQYER
jgi:hypothetical protein